MRSVNYFMAGFIMHFEAAVFTAALSIMSTLAVAASNSLSTNSVIAYRDFSWSGGIYARGALCPSIYTCSDSVQLRLEIERERRMQWLREFASSAPPRYDPAEGPWGRQRYVPPPTPEATVQPAYRDKSVLRPEYRAPAAPVGSASTKSDN
jgi:hypothetical protein